MAEPTDGELLTAWLAGDAAAFGGLVDRWQGPLLRYARFLPGHAEAEDVVQETFLRLARTPPELPEETRGHPRRQQAHLASWLYRVTRSRAMEQLRSDSRRERRERRTAPPEAARGGQESVEAFDTRRAVVRGLERLPDAQREVLVLRLLGERTHREIAEITGRKLGTVAWLVHEGLAALGRSLTPVLEPDAASRAVRLARRAEGTSG
ncbi:MAG: RNA polymerase sigma factor [Planctomycetota bacterium JB042]